MIFEGVEYPNSRTALWHIRLRLFRESFAKNWRLFIQTKIGLVGLAILGFYFLMVLAHPVLMKTVWEPRIYDPVIGYDPRLEQQPAPPSLRHPLGTDARGADVLSKLMASTRSEFMLAVVAAVVTVSIATFVGAASAYFGGVVDAILMRFVDIAIMLPFISLLVVFSAFVDLGLLELGLLIGVLGGFGSTAVILKSQALTIKIKPYVEAARASGGGGLHIVFVHIIPGILPLSFLYMMFTVTAAIFSEATLAYLGLIDVETSWGNMIQTAETFGYFLLVEDFWWLVLPVSVSITLLSMSFYLIGRALDEVLNPRLRRR